MSETWAGPQTWDDTIGTQGQECPHLATRTPEFSATLYETLSEAREKCPVAWDETRGCWFVVGGQTLFDVAHDWETYSSALGVGGPQFPQLLPMDADPPQHRDWRRVLNPFFTKKILETTEAGIRAIAERLVDRLPAEGPVEMVAAFARPLPGQVFFSQILDLPDDELEHCQELVERAVLLNNVEQMVAAQTELNEYVRMLVARRQARPAGDDLLGAVVHAEINGEPVRLDDAVSIVTMLIFGGLETTTNTLGSTLLQLGRDQELQQRLRDNPELLPASVEEFLRLHAPTIDLSRYVTRPTVLEGLSIEAGQRVALSFAAANRDPKIFENPDEFSLERPHNRHYAFGVGIHRCLGSNLARLVLRVALEVLLQRLRDIKVADGFQPVYHPVGVRSLESLDLTFRIEQPAAA